MNDSDQRAEEAAPSFDDLQLPDPVRQALEDLGYDTPTPVQSAAFAPALAGKDLVVQARTGTGKTTAFGLPLVSGRIRASENIPQALILTPTRELALQVSRELEKLAQHTDLTVVTVYGGAPIGKQLDELAKGPQIVAGTPGRVLDHIRRGSMDTTKLKTFILDECDEMLSMGFLPQITEIWNTLPSSMQTLLFSATVPSQVERIADTRLKSPTFIALSGDHVGALEIQHFVFLSHGDKPKELLQIIEVENPESAIVFCNTRDETKRACRTLQDAGYKADWLSSDLGQSDREKVMKATRGGELRFLVCTDVAARGIDISHLTHVINYDFPDNSENYVHRTGRTGRAGKMGTAISLVEPSSIGDLYYLRLKYKINPVERTLPTRHELATRAEADVVAALALRFPPLPPSDRKRSLARRLMTHDDAESLIAGLLGEHLGELDSAQVSAAEQRRVPPPRPAVGNGPGRRAEARPVRRSETDELSGQDASDAVDPKRTEPKRTEPKRRAPERTEPKRTEPKRTDEKTQERSRPVRRASQRFEEEGIGYEVSDASAPASSNTTTPAAKDGSDGQTSMASPEAEEDGAYVSLYLNVGRRDGARMSDIRNALNDAGLQDVPTGRIVLKQRHCFVEVKPEDQGKAIEQLTGTEICGRLAQVEVARPRAEA